MGASAKIWGPIVGLLLIGAVIGVTLGLVLNSSDDSAASVSPGVLPTATVSPDTVTPIPDNKVVTAEFSTIISNTSPFQTATEAIMSTDFVGVPVVNALTCTDPNQGLGVGTVTCALSSVTEESFTVSFPECLVVGSYSAPETGTGQVHNDAGNSGYSMCGLVVQGIPAVFMFGGPGTLYVRATNESGQGSWNSPVTVGAGVSGDSLLWGTIVNGHPACVYVTTTGLEYKRATSAEGNTWPGSPVAVDNAVNGTIMNQIYMVVADDRPVVFYNPDTSNDTIVMRQGTNANGDAFSGTVNVATGLTLQCILGAAIVQDIPAVAYVSAGSVWYVRATQADGLAWGTPVLVDTGASTSANRAMKNGLQVAQGQPIVAYLNTALDEIQIRRAIDTLGATWPGVPAEKGSYPDTGVMQNGSFCIVDGLPCLWFVGHGGNFYRFLYGRDVNGRAWQAVLDETAQIPVGTNSSIVSFAGSTRVGTFESYNNAPTHNTLYREFTVSGTWRLDISWEETVEQPP